MIRKFALFAALLLAPFFAMASPSDGPRDDVKDGGGTTPGTGKVERRMEQAPRATPGAVADGGGRAASGTAAGVTLKDFDGKTRQAGEFLGKGKWTVVTVWSADCPICKAEIFHMTFLHDEHKNRDITVLGLSIDGYANRRKAQGFIDDQKLNFPNLIGGPDDASLLSGTMFIGTPTYYFFTPEGRFAGQRVGPLTQEQAERTIENLKAERARKKG